MVSSVFLKWYPIITILVCSSLMVIIIFCYGYRISYLRSQNNHFNFRKLKVTWPLDGVHWAYFNIRNPMLWLAVLKGVGVLCLMLSNKWSFIQFRLAWTTSQSSLGCSWYVNPQGIFELSLNLRHRTGRSHCSKCGSKCGSKCIVTHVRMDLWEDWSFCSSQIWNLKLLDKIFSILQLAGL